MEKELPQAKCFRKSFRAHSRNHFSEIVASRFPTLFPYLINVTRAPIILTAHVDAASRANHGKGRFPVLLWTLGFEKKITRFKA